MEREVKGFAAIYDNLDGSFDYICEAKTEELCREKAENDMGYDNERIRVYPYFDNDVVYPLLTLLVLRIVK